MSSICIYVLFNNSGAPHAPLSVQHMTAQQIATSETFPGILVKKNQSWWTFLQSPNNSIGHFQTLHRMPGSSGGMSLAASEKSEQTRKVSSLCFQCIDLFMKSLYRCCVMSPRQFGGLRSATKQQTRLKGSSPWSS